MVEELAERLWADNSDLAQAALAHPLVRGLADGSLPRQQFQFYVAQDAFFLEAFARAYAFALARSPDRDGLEAFYRLIGGVLEELRLHTTYAARWHVNLQDVEPSPATLAYTEFLITTASANSLGEICAAMTPCMRLYAFLGQSLAAEARLGLTILTESGSRPTRPETSRRSPPRSKACSIATPATARQSLICIGARCTSSWTFS